MTTSMTTYLNEQNSLSNRAVRHRAELANRVVSKLDSAQAMAQTVHTQAWSRWTPANISQLASHFDRVLTLNNKASYTLLNNREKKIMMRVLADCNKRSTAAIRIQLQKMGLTRRSPPTAAQLRQLTSV